MRRLVAFVLIGMLCQTSVAVAGETLVDSARRAARELGKAEATTGKVLLPARGVVRANLQSPQQQPGLAEAGMRTRTKLLIALGVAAAYAAVALAIDSKVEDSTPSTLGTRED